MRPQDEHHNEGPEEVPAHDQAPDDAQDDLDSMATMASGIRKRPPPTVQPDEDENELPATFTGKLDDDDLTTLDADHGDPFDQVDPLPASAPQEIAGFLIKGIIGQGGMGAVYLAMQRTPRRAVAIKVMRAGVASPMALKRFEFEAQMLARLTHPGIAQIYEAGTFDQGEGASPFFAMEYIPNARMLDEYAKEHNLDIKAKVALLVEVCEAVGSGHAKGIIHRDLKPANILVSSSGRAKIIDFGVARSTDSDQRVTMQTDVHAIVGTLQYMAPEQCAGDVLDLDTAADVYALGVVLYELLTEKLPYEVTGGIATAIKTVTEARPEPISQCDKSLAGDLEVIVAKAMSKDRTDRYRTASELGDDLQRWLNDEPIMARPPTLMTSFKRVVRRNKGLTVLTACMVVILGCAIAGGIWALINRNLALEAQNQVLEEQTEKRAMVGDLITFFMKDSFSAIAKLSNSQEARESLVSVSMQYLNRLRAQSGSDPSLRRMLSEGLQQSGMNQWSLRGGSRGDVGDAVSKWEESIEISDALHAADPADTKSLILSVRGRSLLFDAYRRSGQSEQATKVLAEAESMIDRLPDVNTDVDQGRLVMGVLLDRSYVIEKGADPREDPAFKQMLSLVDGLLETFPDQEHIQRDATLAWNRLASNLTKLGKYEEAISWYERSLHVRERLLQEKEATNTRRRDVNNVRRYIAVNRVELGDLDAAIMLYEQDIVPMARELLVDSPTDQRARNDLARSLSELGIWQRRAEAYGKAIESLQEARRGWSLSEDSADQRQDQLAMYELIRIDLLLADSFFMQGAVNEANQANRRAADMISTYESQWSDAGTNKPIAPLKAESKRLRAEILKKAGTFSAP